MAKEANPSRVNLTLAATVVFLPLDGRSHDMNLVLGPVAPTETAAGGDTSALPIPPD